MHLLLGFPLADGTERTEVAFLGSAAVGSIFQHGSMRTLGFSCAVYMNPTFTLPIHMCTEQRAVLRVCSHICLCVNLKTWYLKVVTGGAGDYWLASQNLFWVIAVATPFATN